MNDETEELGEVPDGAAVFPLIPDGLGVDPLSFANDLLAVAVFDADLFDAEFADLVARNAEGQVITGGDVIWAEPGEEHWHGACGDSLLAHLAVSHGTTEWGGEVGESDYTAAQP